MLLLAMPWALGHMLPVAYPHHPHLISTFGKFTDCDTDQSICGNLGRKFHPPKINELSCCLLKLKFLSTSRQHYSRFIASNKVQVFVSVIVSPQDKVLNKDNEERNNHNLVYKPFR